MRAVIRPGIARGTVAAPPSKSMAHRYLICAALAKGESIVRQVDWSEDIRATADCLEVLGAKLQIQGDTVRVIGCDPAEAASAELPCRESGSTLRFLLPLCLLSGHEMRLRGSGRLMERPLSVYEEICRRQGLSLERGPGQVTVQGVLAPGEYAVPGDVSSQFISGLLFALPLLERGSVIRLIPPVESRSYLDMTVQALRDFGVDVRWQDRHTLTVPGVAVGQPRYMTVEGDYSNAAFFDALNLTGGAVRVTGLRPDSLQGDRVYRQYFAALREEDPCLDLADCPDLAPVLFAAAALTGGARFTGTRRLRFKESDRGSAMAEELAKFGVQMTVSENEIVVPPAALHAPDAPLSSHNDHRIAMALSILCAQTGGVIEGAEAVRKSLPDYWERLQSLHVEVTLDGMDQ